MTSVASTQTKQNKMNSQVTSGHKREHTDRRAALRDSWLLDVEADARAAYRFFVNADASAADLRAEPDVVVLPSYDGYGVCFDERFGKCSRVCFPLSLRALPLPSPALPPLSASSPVRLRTGAISILFSLRIISLRPFRFRRLPVPFQFFPDLTSTTSSEKIR